MHVTVIGGTGHIAGFLVPMLCEAGAEVCVVSSGRKPLPKGEPWSGVAHKVCAYQRDDRAWQEFVKELKSDVIIDLLGVDLPATYQAAKYYCRQLIACGSLWMLGEPGRIPTPEVPQAPCEFPGYARRFREIQEVMAASQREGIAFTAIFPPNIAGPGKVPLETQGGRSLEVHKELRDGKPVVLPEGCNNTIGPCDAEDIAQGFFLAVQKPQEAAGQIFNVGAAYSLTAPSFVETYGNIYNRVLEVQYVDPKEFYEMILPAPAANYHFRAQMTPDITKISQRLGYAPKYTPEEALERAVRWMEAEKLL
jgi:nucleoside-diphosphate-sugar epimerase